MKPVIKGDDNDQVVVRRRGQSGRLLINLTGVNDLHPQSPSDILLALIYNYEQY